MRKLAGVLGGLLVVGVGGPLGAHALAAQKADSTCVTIPVAGQTVCVPPEGLPSPPSAPGLPSVPGPSIPGAPGSAAAGLGSGCSFQSARSDPPPAGEATVTLPDGTVIYRYPATPDPTSASGYMGGTNSLGVLEGSGSASASGVTGQIGGHNNQTGADGYIGSNGACLNGNSLP